MDIFNSILNNIFVPLYQLFLAGTFAYFVFSGMIYMWQMNNSEVRTKMQQHLLWGSVGLFIMFSIGGIWKLFTNIFTGFFG